MEPSYCLFHKNERLQFGWIKELRKNRYVVISETGSESLCAPNQLEYSWSGKLFDKETEALEYIRGKRSWVDDRIQTVEIEIIHELCDAGKPYTIEELAEDFLDAPDDGWERVAFLKAIKKDSRLFKQKKSQFYARTPEEIARLDEEEQKRQEAKIRKGKEREWAEILMSGEKPEIAESERSFWLGFISRFKNFLVHQESNPENAYFRELFRLSRLKPHQIDLKGLQTLNIAGTPCSFGRLILARGDVRLDFGGLSDGSVAAIVAQDPEREIEGLKTRDQTHLKCYAVDDSNTRDYDDALSWEETGDFSYIRLHIADVCNLLPPDSPHFDEAEKRVSSVYTPKGIFPMFPPELSENKFSLIAGKSRGVMTFEIKLNNTGADPEFDLYRSVVRVAENISYEEADRRIAAEDAFWPRLRSFCEEQKRIRIENGALDLKRTEIKLDISDPDQIKIKAVRESTPSSEIIQELSIIANHQAALFCKKHDLKTFYRNQPPYQIVRPPKEGEELSIQDLLIKPARVSLDPEPHSGLGVECYVQVTSPIRRFADLVSQQIIFAQLSGRQLKYSEDELLPWAKICEETQRAYGGVERDLVNYWKLKYLNQHLDEKIQARSVRKLRSGGILVFFPDLQLFAETMLSDWSENRDFEAILEKADPYSRQVILTPLALSPE